MKNTGLLITIEGSDGSGKGTQFNLLVKKLEAEGYDVSSYDFPRYEAESSYFVKQYLNSKYDDAGKLGPYTPSLFYALDRFDASAKIKADLADNKIVICNRYVGSNMAHQATKLSNDDERRTLFSWIEQLEYGMLEIPKPDLNLVFIVPAKLSEGLINKRVIGSSSEEQKGIDELNNHQLEKAVHCYKLLSEVDDTYIGLDCSLNEKLMTIEAVQDMIWRQIKGRVNTIGKHASVKAKRPPKNDDTLNPYIRKNPNGSFSVTSAGKQWLESAVTNINQPVYLTKNKLESLTAAAAMARLSRRGDDLRVTILDEFAKQVDSDANERGDEALLRRVITAYGDDSVQQLVGQHIVVEGASNLLTKKLEWGRLAAYLEQSTRYIFYDQKDENGEYKFFTPKNFDEETTAHYQSEMNAMFLSYSIIVSKLTNYVRENSSEPESTRNGAWRAATRAQACDVARNLLPVATMSTVGIYASGQAIESLIMHLASDDLIESRETGEAILSEARKVIPTFLERADKPDRGGAWVAQRVQTQKNLDSLAKTKSLQPIKGDSETPVKLDSYWPKNELDILPHALYEQSSLSLSELSQEIGNWSYLEKQGALKTYIGERLNRRHKPGRAFEMANYSFDLICDYGIFRDLQRHRMVNALEWQKLTPHYGYKTPKLISKVGLDDEYDDCFDRSMKLFHYLSDNGYVLESQYATLLGHKMRWKLGMNAREAYHFIELRTSPQGHPAYRKLVKQMYQQIKSVHPLIAEGMIFVNKDEDPELTRLAAERATELKLGRLNG